MTVLNSDEFLHIREEHLYFLFTYFWW